MGTVAAFAVAAVVIAAGLWLGWHANRTYVAHSDVRTARNRIAGYRRTRFRSGVLAIAFIVVAYLLLSQLAKH